MNNQIGYYSAFEPPYPWFNYLKISDFVRPGAANTFVFLDEAQSINDGWFDGSMVGYDPVDPNNRAFHDKPAAYHNQAGSFSFVDGHAEIHKWRSPKPDAVADVDWVQSKTTAKKDRPTR
jgi:prepilin-type processing-associated H-X9-DG protein